MVPAPNPSNFAARTPPEEAELVDELEEELDDELEEELELDDELELDEELVEAELELEEELEDGPSVPPQAVSPNNNTPTNALCNLCI